MVDGGVVAVEAGLLFRLLPGGVGDGALGQHAQVAPLRHRQRAVDIVLIGDADGRLDDRYVRLLGGPDHGLVVAGVAEEANLAGGARLPQRLQRLPALQDLQRAGVQQHHVDMVGAQAAQGAVDAVGDQLGGPRLRRLIADLLAALRYQGVLVAARADGAANRRFGAGVAGRGVHQRDPQIEQGAEQPVAIRFRHSEQAKRRAAEADRRRLQPGSAKRKGVHGPAWWPTRRQLSSHPPPPRLRRYRPNGGQPAANGQP